MVLVAHLTSWRNKGKQVAAAAKRDKKKAPFSLLHRRVISRRVSVVVSGTRHIDTPTDVHPREVRFSTKLVSNVCEIAPKETRCSGLHYTDGDLARMAVEMQQEAMVIRKAIEEDGAFSAENDNMTIHGLEEFVFLQMTQERLHCMEQHARRFCRGLDRMDNIRNGVINPAA